VAYAINEKCRGAVDPTAHAAEEAQNSADQSGMRPILVVASSPGYCDRTCCSKMAVAVSRKRIAGENHATGTGQADTELIAL
jgi:hypothetical protein